ncbi:hypothetical protein Esti_006597 [Eimeria stiedai]
MDSLCTFNPQASGNTSLPPPLLLGRLNRGATTFRTNRTTDPATRFDTRHFTFFSALQQRCTLLLAGMELGPEVLRGLSGSPQDFLWLVVFGAIICFLTAFAIGANDVANTFSSSVGSRAIPLGVAIGMAAVLETAGATLLGAAVTDSIRSRIIDFATFEAQPSVLMLGMLCSLLGAGLWLSLANRFGLPVSTTHSIVGALLGFGLASGKTNAIRWKQIAFIVASWLIAPLAASLAGATVFLCIRTFILRAKHPLRRAVRFLWFFIWLIALTFSAFLVLKNPFELHTECDQWMEDAHAVQRVAPCQLSRWSAAHKGEAIGISIGVSVVLTTIISVLVYAFAFHRLRRFKNAIPKCSTRKPGDPPETSSTTPQRLSELVMQVPAAEEQDQGHLQSLSSPQEERKGFAVAVEAQRKGSLSPSVLSVLWGNEERPLGQKISRVWKSMPWFRDIHAEGMEENEFVERLHNDVEMFDVETEIFFSACQVVSACMGCIAHSANDTANAVGPFAAILTIYQHGIRSSVTCSWYILLFGGLAMSLGLALLGYRVIKTVGVKLVKITPARGFSMELGAAWTVLIFSAVGVPLSTTHCAVGSTVGVGLLEPQSETLPFCEGIRRCPPRFPCLNAASVNWKLFGGMIASWIVTILFSAVVSAALFSFAAYSPRVAI